MTVGSEAGTVTSEASTVMRAALALAFFAPVTLIRSVCVPEARPVAVKTGARTVSVGA